MAVLRYPRLSFDYHHLGPYHQQNSAAPKQIYPACPAFTKIYQIKLLHDYTGLPYLKDHLFSCATKSADRIAQNPLGEASILSHRLNPAWDGFPTPLSVIRPGSSQYSHGQLLLPPIY